MLYRKSLVRKLVFTIPFYFLMSMSRALQAQTPLVLYDQVVVPALTAPIDIVNPYDGTDDLYIVERAGVIKRFSAGTISPTPFMDLSSAGLISTEGEGGLLSLAFAPNYATSGYFFIYYTNAQQNIEVARYRRLSPTVGDPGSGKIVMTIAHPQYTNHYGGKLNFGSDGNLYFGTGDGGGSNDPFDNAQDGASLLGKMIRLGVNTSDDTPPWSTVPADNPYLSNAAVNDSIFAIGLRNPFRWSFDRVGTGPWDIWIGDVGQGRWEEVNLSPAGIRKTNYGWPCYEGMHVNTDKPCTATDTLNPLFEYDHSSANGGISITGGMVYRGTDYPALYGWYVFIDFGTGNGWVLHPNEAAPPTVHLQSGLPQHIVGFAENSRRELFAVSLDGPLYQVKLSGVLPVKLQSFTVVPENEDHRIDWQTAFESNLKSFNVQLSTNGTDFSTIASVAASNNSQGQHYSVRQPVVSAAAIFYRLQVVDLDGKFEYSAVVKMTSPGLTDVMVAPTLVRDNRIQVRLKKAYSSLQVINLNGQVLRSRKLAQGDVNFSMDLSGLPKGLYLVRLKGAGTDVNKKISIQ